MIIYKNLTKSSYKVWVCDKMEHDIYPLLLRIYPYYMSSNDYSLDLSGKINGLNICDSCSICRVGRNCKIIGAVLQQSTFTGGTGFKDYYRAIGDLFLCHLSNERIIYGAYRENGKILYFDIRKVEEE